ncbi:hypothetical protein BDZ89DRAFT_1128080 [Hymenopellis radicata]|nr:hypothetical protein BDZ89DRAFT_1128080 [Hymenopellis radicata]
MSAQENLTEVRQDVASQTPLRQPAPEAAEPITSTAASGRARIEQNKKHLFGLEQDVPRPEPVFQDDYEMRLPEDPYGEETKPNARVWRVYVEEAALFDGIMVGQYRDGLDVMLVFAGLFSAVVTSFLVQVSQNLQADYAQMSALLLHDLVSIQLSDGAVANITTPSIDPAQKFRPDALDVWINGLWAASLTAALVVALVSVLVKQWLHHYISLPSGTPLDRSHVRQFRFMGLERWRVRVIIGMLPLIMHVSLMLFLAGLVLFYIPLRVSLAWTIGIGAVVVCILYLVSNTMPLLFPQCPYQTPLTDFLHNTWQLSTTACYTLQKQVMPFVSCWLESDYSQAITAVKSLKTTEAEAVQRAHHTLYVDSLDWLFRMSSNPSVHSIVIQAIGGLPFDSIPHAETVWRESSFLQMARSESIFDSTVDDVEHEYKRKYLL